MAQRQRRSLPDSNTEDTRIAGQATNRQQVDTDKQTEREGEGRYRESRCDTRRCSDVCKWPVCDRKSKLKKKKGHTGYAASAGTDLRMARDTFCFQGLSLRMPMPKPERKNSSPVVTRSHFCEASNSSTAESQMKACSLLLGGGGRRREEGKEGLRCDSTMIYIHIYGSHPSRSLAHHTVCVFQRLPAIAAYGPNEIQSQMGEGRSPIGLAQSHHLNDALLGTT